MDRNLANHSKQHIKDFELQSSIPFDDKNLKDVKLMVQVSQSRKRRTPTFAVK